MPSSLEQFIPRRRVEPGSEVAHVPPMAPPRRPDNERREGPVSVDEAKMILGEQMVKGPEAIQRTFGIKLEAGAIPPIPFDRERLERAARDGMRLVLRVGGDSQGEALTIERMHSLYQQQTKRALINDWSQDNPLLQERFLREEKLQTRWALVGRRLVMGPGSADPFQQTKRLLGQQGVGNDQALQEVKGLEQQLLKDTASGEQAQVKRKEALEELYRMSVNKDVRTAGEVIYDAALLADGPTEYRGYKTTDNTPATEVGFYTRSFTEQGIVWVSDSGDGRIKIVNSRSGWPYGTGLVAVEKG